MDKTNFLFGLAICLTFVTYSSASACGYLLGIQLYCPSGYHCCSEVKSTCCQTATICIDEGTTCLSIGVIIGPILGVLGIIACIVVCVVCSRRRRANQGTVMQPGVTMQGQPNVANPQYPGSQPYPGNQQQWGSPNQGYSK